MDVHDIRVLMYLHTFLPSNVHIVELCGCINRISIPTANSSTSPRLTDGFDPYLLLFLAP